MKLITKHDYIKKGSIKHLENSINYANEDPEFNKKQKHIENSVDYVDKREKSSGLFNIKGTMTKEQVKQEVDYMINYQVHRMILSQNVEHGIKLKTKNDWEKFITKNIDKIAKAYKVPINMINWNCGFHDKENQPHVHLHLYDELNKAHISEVGVITLRNDLISELYKEEIKLYKAEEKVIKKTKDIYTKIDEEVDFLKQKLINEIVKENVVTPKNFEFKRYYQYLDKKDKNFIDNLLTSKLIGDENFEKLIKLEMDKKNIMSTFYGEQLSTKETINKYLSPQKKDKKIFQNVALEILRSKEEIKKERARKINNIIFLIDRNIKNNIYATEKMKNEPKILKNRNIKSKRFKNKRNVRR